MKNHKACDKLLNVSLQYSNLKVEIVTAFRYVIYIAISANPAGDALDRMLKNAKENDVENPKIISWDFPNLSQKQINVNFSLK